MHKGGTSGGPPVQRLTVTRCDPHGSPGRQRSWRSGPRVRALSRMDERLTADALSVTVHDLSVSVAALKK
ncbi:hypothetical protein GCM10029978_055660 [Actinoallomurus acanthiterrae]